MIPQYCTVHPVLRITKRNCEQNIMAAFIAGKLAREKNGRFGKAWFQKRGGNLWKGSKRKVSESDKIVQSVSSLKCEFQVTGRHVVELDLLAKELDGRCKSCGKPLRLAQEMIDCTQEMISGLGSFLYITCGEETCGEINVPHEQNAPSECGHPRKTSVCHKQETRCR